jgi:hypothetical protein
MDITQFFLTVQAHRGLVRLDDFDFRHIDHQPSSSVRRAVPAAVRLGFGSAKQR